jgi:hypothetical protein
MGRCISRGHDLAALLAVVDIKLPLNHPLPPSSSPSPPAAEAAKAERARRRAAAGGIMLPGRYKRVQIKQQQGLRFEEFDFSYYNRTPFTGLENDLANCYTNALLQVGGVVDGHGSSCQRGLPTHRLCSIAHPGALVILSSLLTSSALQ